MVPSIDQAHDEAHWYGWKAYLTGTVDTTESKATVLRLQPHSEGGNDRVTSTMTCPISDGENLLRIQAHVQQCEETQTEYQ